ncbi:MAG: 6-carboxytetrahydropterin synthase QueD [Bacteroidota bacterium]
MPAIITKKFTFEAAHHLPQMPEGHKCRRLHGHSFRLEVNVLGEIDPSTGMVMDFGDIKAVVKPYVDYLDHWCINDVAERDNIELLKNPTSENLAHWLYEEIKPKLPGLYSVVVHETCTSRCEYRPHFD